MLLSAVFSSHFLSNAYSQERSFPPTRDGIHVFYDQLPGWLSEAQVGFAARNYAGCQKMVLDDIRRLRSYNPGFIVLHYQLALGQGQWNFIDGNQWVQDWDDSLPAFHSYAGAGPVIGREGWFVTWDGSRVWFPGWGWYIMDITFGGESPNTGYPDYWLAACKEKMRNTECDGVFADSFTIDSYFGQTTSSHPWFNEIAACSAGWVPALQSYAAYILADFAAQTENFYFLPNLGALVTGWDPTDYAALGHGGMNEGFGQWGPSSPFDIGDWQLQMDRLLALSNADRILLLECHPDADSPGERMFLIGCYLLVKGDRTYITLSGANVDIEWFPEYGIDLGPYTGGVPADVASLYIADWGVYRREYERGFVLVNPTDSARSIPDLDGIFRLAVAQGGGAVPENGVPSGVLSFSEVTAVELPPYSGAVLIDPAATTPPPAATPIRNNYHTDFNGDGTSDIAIFRPTTGLWAVRQVTRAYFGTSSDIPVPGDYSGDGTGSIAIFRPATGLWAARGVTRTYFGTSSDTAVPIQFNPSSPCRVGVFRESSGLWAVKGVTRTYFGASGDLPVPGDYSGDGTKDLGIFRKSSGLWAIKGFSRMYFGTASDATVPGDYSGDGTWSPAVFRSSSGLWAVRGFTRAYFGSSSDLPVPGGYRGDGKDYIGIFRGTSGLWAIKGVTRTYFGSGSDVPVTR